MSHPTPDLPAAPLRARRRFSLPRGLDRLPPALLVVMALQQIWLAKVERLSPWSGGGFGMFSSSDHWTRRHLHVWTVQGGHRSELFLPTTPEVVALDPWRFAAIALPTEKRLRDLALRIAELPQARAEGEPDAIALEVYRARFDPETLAPTGEMLREVEVPLGGR